jgi:O-antigen/teichoic acid export membrane protein
MAANSIFTDFLQGVKQIGQYVVINLISGIALTATTVIAVALQKGAIGVATSYLVGPITSFILLIMVLHRLGISIKVRFDKSVMCSTLKQSGSWTASSFLTILRDRLEQMLIPHLVGMQAMGYYTAGSMPTDKLQIVPDGLATAFYPAVASGTDASQQRHAIHQVVVLCTIICVAFAILLYVLAKPLAQFLFPHSPFACQHVIQITALALPFIGLTYPVSSCLVAAGRQNQVSRVTMYATCFSMAGSLIIIMHSGLAGACWSYVMRYVVSVLFLLPCLAREFPGLLPRLPLLRIVISTGATVMLMQLSIFAAKTLSGSRIIHFGDSALCVMVGTSSLMFFIAMLFIVGVLRKSEIALLIGKPGRTVV